MRWKNVDQSACPIAKTLRLVGDRWTLLIMRELSLNSRRFDEIQAQTGISSHLLSTRLRRLEADGIIERREFSEGSERMAYFATAKGKDLNPLLLLLRLWGEEWLSQDEDGGPAITLTHKVTGQAIPNDWYAAYLKKFQGLISPVYANERKEKCARQRAALI